MNRNVILALVAASLWGFVYTVYFYGVRRIVGHYERWKKKRRDRRAQRQAAREQP